jgi:16S rRNA (uracil1498-N3)-methyltransferase
MMSAPKGKARLYVENELNPNTQFVLNKDQAHYLSRVMRCHAGDNIDVFNGQDGEWQCHISQISKAGVELTANHQAQGQISTNGPWLAFAPVKKTRTDFIVEKATELGVSALIPVFTANTATSRVKAERLQTIAIEAAEQCRRLDIPKVHEPQSLKSFLDAPLLNRALFVLDETGNGIPLPTIINSLEKAPDACFLIGPEGGFQTTELDALGKLPFVTMVGVGPRILRAETAAVAALSCWQAMTGAWGTD